ncbi:MAG: YdcH family protein [Desulfuromonadaceae bacterium]
MEERDTVQQEVVQRLFDGNPRFRRLYEEHHLLEKELKKLDQKPYLTPDEEIERKKVQKLKLAGKDEMTRIMMSHLT